MLEKALAQARRELGERKFFEAHETLEDAWHELPEGDLRAAVQGLVQLCAGLHKGKGPGASYLFERGMQKLERCGASLPAGATEPFLAAARKAMLGA